MQKTEIENEQFESELNKNQTLKKIQERYSDKELKAIAEGGRIVPGYAKVPVIDFDGQRIRFGAFGDTHFGSKDSKIEHFELVIKEFKKERCDFAVHTGDVTEGMNNRPGHVFELSHLGYAEQKKYAIELLSLWEKPLYMIDGNHDRWFINSNGAIIVKDIADSLKKAEFLGHDEGDITLKGKTVLKLWHGEDGNSYATSYRIQKIIESFTGGQKPGMLIVGHTHKQIYMFERHIQAFSAGCIQMQTRWMRGKRIQAHPGFWIIDVWVNDSGISKVRSTWYPFYC